MALTNEDKDKRKLQVLKEQKNELIAAIKELKMQKERTDGEDTGKGIKRAWI